MRFGIFIPYGRARAHGIFIARLSAAFSLRFLCVKVCLPIIKAFPFSDLFSPYAEFFRKLVRRHGSAGFKPSPAHFVPLRASRFCHCLRTPFRLFPIFRPAYFRGSV